MSGSRNSLKKPFIRFNPTAENNWSKDDSKFGQRMLEKMGWKKGQGIGLNNQGMSENIKIRLKSDCKGLGFKIRDDQWLKIERTFTDVLSNLNQSLNAEECNKFSKEYGLQTSATAHDEATLENDQNHIVENTDSNQGEKKCEQDNRICENKKKKRTSDEATLENDRNHNVENTDSNQGEKKCEEGDRICENKKKKRSIKVNRELTCKKNECEDLQAKKYLSNTDLNQIVRKCEQDDHIRKNSKKKKSDKNDHGLAHEKNECADFQDDENINNIDPNPSKKKREQNYEIHEKKIKNQSIKNNYKPLYKKEECEDHCSNGNLNDVENFDLTKAKCKKSNINQRSCELKKPKTSNVISECEELSVSQENYDLKKKEKKNSKNNGLVEKSQDYRHELKNIYLNDRKRKIATVNCVNEKFENYNDNLENENYEPLKGKKKLMRSINENVDVHDITLEDLGVINDDNKNLRHNLGECNSVKEMTKSKQHNVVNKNEENNSENLNSNKLNFEAKEINYVQESLIIPNVLLSRKERKTKWSARLLQRFQNVCHHNFKGSNLIDIEGYGNIKLKTKQHNVVNKNEENNSENLNSSKLNFEAKEIKYVQESLITPNKILSRKEHKTERRARLLQRFQNVCHHNFKGSNLIDIEGYGNIML